MENHGKWTGSTTHVSTTNLWHEEQSRFITGSTTHVSTTNLWHWLTQLVHNRINHKKHWHEKNKVGDFCFFNSNLAKKWNPFGSTPHLVKVANRGFCLGFPRQHVILILVVTIASWVGGVFSSKTSWVAHLSPGEGLIGRVFQQYSSGADFPGIMTHGTQLRGIKLDANVW